MKTMPSLDTQALTETLIYELTKAFALPQRESVKRWIRLVFGKAAHAAAEMGIRLDRAVAEGGLCGDARWILPRGGIEADPDFMPNADEEFKHGSRSLEIFLNRVPELQILTTITSGVISPQAFRHPITWFRRHRPTNNASPFSINSPARC